jgi:DNA-binding NtrC family response regulator
MDDNAATAPPARILILEDEAWDAELAQRLLKDAGLSFTAVIVATEAAFVEQIAVFRPEVVLSDYFLPGFSGERALDLVKVLCPDVPFVFWSGVLGDDAAVELIKRGATDYVLKDRPARLPSAIRRALDDAAQKAQLAELGGHLVQAQHLASLGHLAEAEQAVRQTRERVAAARERVLALSRRA